MEGSHYKHVSGLANFMFPPSNVPFAISDALDLLSQSSPPEDHDYPYYDAEQRRWKRLKNGEKSIAEFLNYAAERIRASLLQGVDPRRLWSVRSQVEAGEHCSRKPDLVLVEDGTSQSSEITWKNAPYTYTE